MTSCPVLRCLAPRLPVLSVGFGSVFCSMPLGRIAGPPVTPLSLTIPARKSATTCFSAAFSASRRSVRASRSPRDSSERGIFSGTDMLGTNRVRYEQGQPRSSSYLPGFLPQVLTGGGERVLSQERDPLLVSTSPENVSTRHQWFAHARLRDPHLTGITCLFPNAHDNGF